MLKWLTHETVIFKHKTVVILVILTSDTVKRTHTVRHSKPTTKRHKRKTRKEIQTRQQGVDKMQLYYSFQACLFFFFFFFSHPSPFLWECFKLLNKHGILGSVSVSGKVNFPLQRSIKVACSTSVKVVWKMTREQRMGALGEKILLRANAVE